LRQRWQDSDAVGYRQLVAVAEHVATNRLVAFSALGWQDTTPEVGWQGYTFVTSDHRGHRLGMLVKTEMLLQVAVQAPAMKRIYTENATENAPMLSINIDMGFQLAMLEGTFQKKTI